MVNVGRGTHSASRGVAAGLAAALAVFVSGCTPSSFLAHRIQQAPNTYPDWFAPTPKVWYSLPRGAETHFHRESILVGPPEAKLAFRVVEPAEYHSRMQEITGFADGRTTHYFRYSATIPGIPFPPSRPVAGTLVLLHGYGLDERVMMPWALHFASLGWRCVLVDLRGHGRSGGRKVFFGPVEARDLTALLDALHATGRLTRPVLAAGESYGAAVSLRFASVEPRVDGVIAIAPYAALKPAILAIRAEYASWAPEGWVAGAADRLPALTGAGPGGLDPEEWAPAVRQPTLLLGGGKDTVAPPEALRRLQERAGGAADVVILPDAIHETLPLQLGELEPPADRWLAAHWGINASSASAQPARSEGQTSGTAH